MITRSDPFENRLRIKMFGRACLALAGGGLFAFLAWPEVPATHEQNKAQARPEQDKAQKPQTTDSNDHPSAGDGISDAQQMVADPWGVAADLSEERREPTHEENPAGVDTEADGVRFMYTATADGMTGSTRTQNSRDPP